MIELPEATLLADQMAHTLTGKRIARAVHGHTPHKWAFSTLSSPQYAELLHSRTLGTAYAQGSAIILPVQPEMALLLGGGGERIAYHADPSTIPAKHQLLLEFTDATTCTVTVQGWGMVKLVPHADIRRHVCRPNEAPSPLDPVFTLQAFNALFEALRPDDPRAIKFFIISDPSIAGIGNGYLQDILFAARIHPRTRAAALSPAQRRDLHKALTTVIRRAAKAHGRTDELDLFGNPGRYRRTLSADTANTPCPTCGDTIIKDSFLGGAIYFCPTCQPPPPMPAKAKPRIKKRP